MDSAVASPVAMERPRSTESQPATVPFQLPGQDNLFWPSNQPSEPTQQQIEERQRQQELWQQQRQRTEWGEEQEEQSAPAPQGQEGGEEQEN